MTKIVLDKERNLQLDLNAMKKFHELTGRNLLGGGLTNITPGELIAFLWCCLIHEESDLTQEQVGAMVSIDNIGTVTEAVIDLSDKKGEETENPLSVTGLSASSTST